MNPRRGSPSFIVLQRVGVVAVIGELKARGVSEHVRVKHAAIMGWEL